MQSEKSSEESIKLSKNPSLNIRLKFQKSTLATFKIQKINKSFVNNLTNDFITSI